MKQGRVARVFSMLISIVMLLNMVPAPALAEALTELQVDGSSQSVGLEEVLQTTEAKGAVTESEPESGSAMPAFEGSQEVVGATVTVKAPDGTFPVEATLRAVEGIEAMPDEPERERIAQAVKVARAPRTEDVQHDQEAQTETDSASEDAEDEAAPQPKPNVATTHTLRIQVLDGNGNELQPAGDQRAEVILSLAEAADKNLTASVYHVSSKAKGEYEAELVAKRKVSITDEEKGTVSFMAADLSSWYVVEFGYDNLSLELSVGDETPLVDVLDAVGLAGEVEAVRTEGNEGLVARDADGIWTVAAAQAFNSEAWLVVTIAEREYRIAITTPKTDITDDSDDADNADEQTRDDQGTSEKGDAPTDQDSQDEAGAPTDQPEAVDKADEQGTQDREGDEGVKDKKTLLQTFGLPQPTAAPALGSMTLLSSQTKEVVDSFGTASGGKYVLQDGTTYKLTKDFNLGSDYIEVPAGATATIDLGGHTLKRTLSEQSESSVIENNGTLTVKNGTITGGWANIGGGVYNFASGNLSLEGVTVSGNKAKANSGGIRNAGSLHVKDSEVTGNSLTSSFATTGSGIYSSGEITIGGRVAVSNNNGPSNLYLGSNKVINVDGKLDQSSNIGITTTGYPRYLTSGLVASGNSSVGMFYLDNAPEGISLVLVGGELYAKQKADKAVSSWSELQTAIDAAPAGQVIELAGNIKAADGDIRLDIKPNKNVVIDLAGYTLDRGLTGKSAQSNTGHVIWVESGATLTIRDSGATGKIIGGNISGNGGGINVHGTLNVEGGAITGNKATGNGGGIMVKSGGSLKMTYGSVTNNSGGDYGGGICADGAVTLSNCTIATNTAKYGGGMNFNHKGKTSTLTDVTFDGNTSTAYGGAIYQWAGTLEITRGSIVHNVSDDCGGIYVKDDSNTLTATGTLFDDNKSTHHSGGAIVNYRTVQLKDCTFTNNSAFNNGGAIWNKSSSANLTVEGGTFSKNSALEKGGAIYCEEGATVSIDGGTYTQNYGDRYGGGIHITESAKNPNIKGAPVVKDNKTGGVGKNLFLGKGRKLNVNGPMEDGANVGVDLGNQVNASNPNTSITFTTGFNATNEGKDPADFFVSDVIGISVYKDDKGEAKLGASTWSNLQALINSAESGDTIVLQTDYTKGPSDDSLRLEDKSLTIDLNGHTLNANTAESDMYSVFTVSGKTAALTVKDGNATDGTAGGTITGGSFGGVFISNNATFNLEGGTITGNIGYYVGGVWVSSGTFNMSGGVISDNALNAKNSTAGGAGVQVGQSSTFNLTGGKIENNSIEGQKEGPGAGVYCMGAIRMSGGEILSNSSNSSGGGLYVTKTGSATIEGGRIAYNSAIDGGGIYATGSVTLSGGTITGNKAKGKALEFGKGGGIVGGNISVQGSPVVSGNSAGIGDDVYLGEGQTISVAGALASDAKVGVALEKGFGTFTTGFKANNGEKDPSSAFFATDETLAVIADANGEGYMQGGWTLLQEQINAAGDGATIKLEKSYRANEGETSLVIPEGKKLTIDLNGYIISRGLVGTQEECLDPTDDGTHVFVVSKGAELTIADSSASEEVPEGAGAITGGMAKHGGGIYVEGKLILEGGSIASNLGFLGAGVYVAPGAEFVLDGGAVKGNRANGKTTSSSGAVTEEMTFGGGVFVDDAAYMTMNGGVVDGNYSLWGGGGIGVERDASMVMNDGVVSNNTAMFGGAIYSNGVTLVSGGEISSNAATNLAGAIYAYKDKKSSESKVAVSGGVIKNNHSQSWAGAILSFQDALHLSGGTIEGNTADVGAGGIEAYGLYVSGAPVVKDNDAPQGKNLVLHDDTVMNVEEGGLGNGADIHFVAQNVPRNVTTGLNATDASVLQYFSYDADASYISLVLNSGELYVNLGANTWVSSWAELQKAIDNSTAGEVIGLEADLSPEKGDTRFRVDNKKDVVIELAGHTINRSLYRVDDEGAHEEGYSESEGHVFYVANGSTLTVRDASGGLGTITGGNAKRGGGLNVSGTFNLQSGTIAQNHSKDVGGGVCLNSNGTLNVAGGTIMGNATGDLGGGLCLDGKTTLSNCTILGNEAKDGAGIYVNVGSKAFKMTDVAVVGNAASNAGGGAALKSGTMQVERSSFTGNTSPDGGGVYVTEDTTMNARYTQFSNNTVNKKSGGGFVNSLGTVDLYSCTISDNTAHGSGGGVYTSGKTTLTLCTLSNNVSYDSGGGAMVNNGGKLELVAMDVFDNDASSRGGGVFMSGSAKSVSVDGRVSIDNNDGGNVYLASGKKLTMAGPLVAGNTIGVILEKAEGTFTSGYSRWEGSVDPATFFKSDYGYEVYLNGNEAAMRVQFSEEYDKTEFIKRAEQVNDPTTGANWMGGISGERYLNEINIPYTHDSAMKNAYAWVGSSAGALLGFSKSAETQHLFIDEQLEAGVRILDIRLSNYYNHHTFWDEVAFWGSGVLDVACVLGAAMTAGFSNGVAILVNPLTVAGAFGAANHCTEDDGSNLWLCHGKTAVAGVFWGEDHDGEMLNFKQVLRWAEDFLRQHPDETIILNCSPETPDDKDSDKKIVYQRLRDHLKEVYATVNPSTGRSYLYQESGSDSPFTSPSRMPQLKECRGQIILMGGGGDVHGLSLTAGGLEQISDGTKNDVGADEKIEQLKALYERSADLALTTNANEHLDYILAVDTNSKADDFPEILDPSMRPLRIAEKVHPEFFGVDKVYGNPDNLGRYFGWVKMDGATAYDISTIYRSNFFDGLEYVTVTAKPSADALPSETKTYKLLKYTDFTIPECIYDDPDAEKGSFLYWMAVDSKGNMTAYEPKDAFEVSEDVTFIAQWDNDKTAQAKVYEVFQGVDGSWEEPDEAVARAYSTYTPGAHEHFTVSGYSTEFTSDEQGRTALKPGASATIEQGKTKLYVYYTRNTYDLVYYEDMAGTKAAKTVKVPYEAYLDDYAEEYLTKDGCIFAGWSTTPKTDGELYYYEDTIPDSWKDEDVAKEHPCVLYRFGDTMPARTLNLYPVFRAEAEEPTFRTHSLILDGSIGVNFFMELPKMAQIDYSTSYMEFSVSGRGGTTTTDPFDAEYMNKQHGYYGFTCYVSSIQMADTITATYHYTVDGENRQVSQEYSIAQYVSDFNKISADYDQVTRDLIFSLADFGHYTQPYLSGIHGWSIGDDYKSMSEHAALTADMVEEARSASATYAVKASVPAGGEVKAVSMGLDLETNTTMRLYVSTKDNAGIKSCALADGTPLSVEQTSDGRWVVSVSGIMAHELDKAYDVRITTTGGTNVRVVASALSFAWAVFGSSAHKDDLDAQYLATALWRYWRCADNYIKA